jgi:hypothetical protein
MDDLQVDEPLHGFLLVLRRRNQAKIFEETLEVNVWRSG